MKLFLGRCLGVIALIDRKNMRIGTPFALGLFLAISASSLFAADLTGQASVIDGDTLEMHGTRIRLWGIDAPESSQLCRGNDSLQYRCGAKSANELDAFIGGRPLACAPIDRDRYGRTVATCKVAGIDLADWLVQQGLALDWPRYSNGRYSATQTEARRRERGMWAGSFVEPWRFRDCVRLGGQITSCSDQ